MAPPSAARRQRAVAILVAALVAGVSLAAADHEPGHDAADAPAHRHLGEVAEGDLGALTGDEPAVFWDTPRIECHGDPGTTEISAPRTCDEGLVLTWTASVVGIADELRVDFDQPFRQDDVELLVISPAGQRLTAASRNTYSGGIRALDPSLGDWTISLTPVRTNGTTVRLRAGLVDPAEPTDDVLLPNLRVTPPFEFGFVAPVSPLNPLFLAGDDQNPGLAVAGQSVASCASDEVVEAADASRQDEPKALTRCLRFTTGPHNVGAGHFDLRFPILDRALADRDRLVEMTQHVHHRDGTTTQRPAGTYEYHVTHGHWHYLDILFYEAFEVTDATTGALRPVGRGNKSGFCPADQGYGEWSTFDQGPAGAVAAQQSGGCLVTSGNGAMGLSAGWGDFYRWQRSGQYIDFSGVGDGNYLVRATVDVLGNVLESDETDNTSYAWLCVAGDEVGIIERGQGLDPWDPAKRIARDHRAALGCGAAPASLR